MTDSELKETPRTMKKASTAKTQPRSAAQIFKAIDNVLKLPGSGCSGSLDYMEQSSWLLFLRYLDAFEEEREAEARFMRLPYTPALPKRLRWHEWAYPLTADGKLDTERMMVGDTLIAFVNQQLFPGLVRLMEENIGDKSSIQYRVGSVFSELTSKFTSGYTLREVIELIEPLRFETEEERHEMSVLYESRLGVMGNAGRDGGQYYTPRSLIRVMVRILSPELGEKVYDGACGSGGFLCEAFNFMRERYKDTSGAWDILQKKTFYGKEVKALPFVTAQMNCILHGLVSPSIEKGNTLAERIADYQSSDRVDAILANPPFGAGVNRADQENFTIRTSETALLFMEHFIAKLKRGGRAAIVIKNTFLSNTDNASVGIRRMLLEKCELEWVLDLPQKVFVAGVHTVVLFFRKGKPTTKPINYYELNLGDVSLGKTRPLLESDLAEFESMVGADLTTEGGKAPTAIKSPCHWQLDPETIDQTTFDLSVKNPNRKTEELPSAAECRARIAKIYAELGKVLQGNTEATP